MSDRFPSYASTAPGAGCAPLPGMQLPYSQGLPPEQQPHSLYGLDYMTWSAYCDHDSFLPLAYDNDGIRWMQDNVQGSPVIVEAQSFDLYRMSSRYTWNTGLPDVVGWDYHTRQHNAAIPTEFVTTRGNEIIAFYTGPDIPSALAFLQRYDARYVIVGPMEQAYYGPSGGLAKFDTMVAQGLLSVAYRNPGTVICRVYNGGRNGAQYICQRQLLLLLLLRLVPGRPVAGLAALPLCFQLFRHLPDRGYTFSKALGLLAAGWVFWFLGSVGFLRNDAPGVIFAVLVVAVAGLVWLGPGAGHRRAARLAV